jgi:hypothetical protein
MSPRLRRLSLFSLSQPAALTALAVVVVDAAVIVPVAAGVVAAGAVIGRATVRTNAAKAEAS